MTEKTKQKQQTSRLRQALKVVRNRSASEQERITDHFSEEKCYERVADTAFSRADEFAADSTLREQTLLHIDNINNNGRSFVDIARTSPAHLDALIETLYLGFGVEAPIDDVERWVYNAEGSEHVATTSTDFGFNIVEERFLIENTDPQFIPSPHECGMYNLSLIRQLPD